MRPLWSAAAIARGDMCQRGDKPMPWPGPLGSAGACRGAHTARDASECQAAAFKAFECVLPCRVAILARDFAAMLNFQTKLIEKDGHRYRIVCQNENGPCPLLAICNALVLRGALELPAHASDIDASQLQHILVGWLVDKSQGAAHDANRTFQIDEAIKVVQQGRLMEGLDVNPKFGSPESMEFTQGLPLHMSSKLRAQRLHVCALHMHACSMQIQDAATQSHRNMHVATWPQQAMCCT